MARIFVKKKQQRNYFYVILDMTNFMQSKMMKKFPKKKKLYSMCFFYHCDDKLYEIVKNLIIFMKRGCKLRFRGYEKICHNIFLIKNINFLVKIKYLRIIDFSPKKKKNEWKKTQDK